MERYRYTLTASSPISAGQSDQRANTRRAHQVVPGATLRGAIAARWWRGKDPDDPRAADDFDRIFEAGLLVGQAVPADLELLSASARVCKYVSEPGCERVLLDLAVNGDEVSACSVCQGPLAGKSGWRRRPGQRRTAQVSRTRGALTTREAAEPGKLFTRRAITGHQGPAELVGVLYADSSVGDWLDGLGVRVGGGRSLDYGNATLTLSLEPWPALPESSHHVIRVASPTILLDEFAGPSITPGALQAELRRVSGDRGLNVRAQPDWLRTESVSGWHMRSRLPKVLDWALAPGSVVTADGLTAEGWNRLQRGIGWRTLEGYGQVELVGAVTEREGTR